MKVKAALCVVMLLQAEACWADNANLHFSQISICGELACFVNFFQEFYPGRDIYERLFFWRSGGSSGSVEVGVDQKNNQLKEKDLMDDEPPPLSWGFAGLFTALAIIIRRKMQPRPARLPAQQLSCEPYSSRT